MLLPEYSQQRKITNSLYWQDFKIFPIMAETNNILYTYMCWLDNDADFQIIPKMPNNQRPYNGAQYVVQIVTQILEYSQ